MTLDDVIAALDASVAWTCSATGPAPAISGIYMLDVDDAAAFDGHGERAHIAVLVGLTRDATLGWLRSLPPEQRPCAVMTKAFTSVGEAAAVAGDVGVWVVGIHKQARWDTVLAVVGACLDRRADPADAGRADSTDVDLVGLVGLVSQGTRGLVSIEDATSSRLLAYSPSYGEADDLRRQTVLGRRGPPTYLRLLRTWGVLDAIRRDASVVNVPAHPEEGMSRRLVVGVHSHSGRHLGSIWVQEGAEPLTDDAVDVLQGASAIAARILTRALLEPSTETQFVQRLFGAHGGIDTSTAAEYLRWPEANAISVIGICAVGGDHRQHAEMVESVAGRLRLHASAFAASALTSVIGNRAYILLPETKVTPLSRWTNSLVAKFDSELAALSAGPHPARLHAAIVTPSPGLVSVPAARDEIDRVLSAVALPQRAGESRVTTLARSRTAVLLSEILATIDAHDQLSDPRIGDLIDYDDKYDAELVKSVATYLDCNGNTREAARRLNVHTNTLRYRLERAQNIAGLHLADPRDRLLTSIQLALLERRSQ